MATATTTGGRPDPGYFAPQTVSNASYSGGGGSASSGLQNTYIPNFYSDKPGQAPYQHVQPQQTQAPAQNIAQQSVSVQAEAKTVSKSPFEKDITASAIERTSLETGITETYNANFNKWSPMGLVPHFTEDAKQLEQRQANIEQRLAESGISPMTTEYMFNMGYGSPSEEGLESFISIARNFEGKVGTAQQKTEWAQYQSQLTKYKTEMKDITKLAESQGYKGEDVQAVLRFQNQTEPVGFITKSGKEVLLYSPTPGVKQENVNDWFKPIPKEATNPTQEKSMLVFGPGQEDQELLANVRASMEYEKKMKEYEFKEKHYDIAGYQIEKPSIYLTEALAGYGIGPGVPTDVNQQSKLQIAMKARPGADVLDKTLFGVAQLGAGTVELPLAPYAWGKYHVEQQSGSKILTDITKTLSSPLPLGYKGGQIAGGMWEFHKEGSARAEKGIETLVPVNKNFNPYALSGVLIAGTVPVVIKAGQRAGLQPRIENVKIENPSVISGEGTGQPGTYVIRGFDVKPTISSEGTVVSTTKGLPAFSTTHNYLTFGFEKTFKTTKGAEYVTASPKFGIEATYTEGKIIPQLSTFKGTPQIPVSGPIKPFIMSSPMQTAVQKHFAEDYFENMQSFSPTERGHILGELRADIKAEGLSGQEATNVFNELSQFGKTTERFKTGYEAGYKASLERDVPFQQGAKETLGQIAKEHIPKSGETGPLTEGLYESVKQNRILQINVGGKQIFKGIDIGNVEKVFGGTEQQAKIGMEKTIEAKGGSTGDIDLLVKYGPVEKATQQTIGKADLYNIYGKKNVEVAQGSQVSVKGIAGKEKLYDIHVSGEPSPSGYSDYVGFGIKSRPSVVNEQVPFSQLPEQASALTSSSLEIKPYGPVPPIHRLKDISSFVTVSKVLGEASGNKEIISNINAYESTFSKGFLQPKIVSDVLRTSIHVSSPVPSILPSSVSGSVYGAITASAIQIPSKPTSSQSSSYPSVSFSPSISKSSSISKPSYPSSSPSVSKSSTPSKPSYPSYSIPPSSPSFPSSPSISSVISSISPSISPSKSSYPSSPSYPSKPSYPSSPSYPSYPSSPSPSPSPSRSPSPTPPPYLLKLPSGSAPTLKNLGMGSLGGIKFPRFRAKGQPRLTLLEKNVLEFKTGKPVGIWRPSTKVNLGKYRSALGKGLLGGSGLLGKTKTRRRK